MRIREIVRRLRETLRPARANAYRGSRGLGQRWEALAERKLRAVGYRVLELNYRGRSGEIDLIAVESGVLCFIEVKGRSLPGFGAPEDAVTLEKQRRIARTAQEFLQRRRLAASTPCRFDVVSIIDRGDGAARVELHRDAFPLPESPGGRRVLK
jgi:putative endonuclease